MSATPPKQILPPIPTVSPNTTFTPVPTTTLSGAPPSAEMLQNWQWMDDTPSLPGYQTSRGAPQQSSETGRANSDFHSVILLEFV
ncbi:hypothetical protein AMELA_G00128350 [Ameiurus melas]|uniref:Uncharacterized protein n=1 Tax=Ameiurus melas TaxID=219545 RepID=A0A7J6ANG8_AMEME|nr:hypothetical protein AMELA_G00128350 [Ameiurus melas]